jgi:hypothetical protein
MVAQNQRRLLLRDHMDIVYVCICVAPVNLMCSPSEPPTPFLHVPPYHSLYPISNSWSVVKPTPFLHVSPYHSLYPIWLSPKVSVISFIAEKNMCLLLFIILQQNKRKARAGEGKKCYLSKMYEREAGKNFLFFIFTPCMRVLCFGDSLTAGYYSSGMKFHPYALTLQVVCGITVIHYL